MDIDRNVPQVETNALERIRFCLDQLEKAKGFDKGISWGTTIANGRLTIEEVIGALVSAEQVLEGTEA